MQLNITEEDWEAFKRRWDLFKAGTKMSQAQVTSQLIQCCGKE